MLLKSDQIYLEDGLVACTLVIEDGKLKEVLPYDNGTQPDYDFTGFRVIPGVFDTHNHGSMGYALWGNSDDPEAQVRGYLKAVASQGVTSVFPTAWPDMIRAVANVAHEDLIGARVMGIHSEGPYLNRVGEMGVDVEPPKIDMQEVQQIWDDSKGLLKLMAIAPELPGSQEVVDFMRAKGVHMAYAHSNYDYAEAMDAINRGLTVTTHTANVMSGIHHRRMGGLGACLLHPTMMCEVICDGMHIAPEMLELMFRVKDLDHWMMISDMAETSGAPIGRYKMEQYTIIVDELGFCKTETGRIMGSTQPVVHGMKVLVEEVGMPLEQVLRLSGLNPARFYGFDDRKGSLLPGKDADLVVIDDNYKPLATFVEGIKVYDRNQDTDLFNPVYLAEFQAARVSDN